MHHKRFNPTILFVRFGLNILFSATLFIQNGVAQDWAQFLGNGTGHCNKNITFPKQFPKEGPKILWQKNIGSGWAGPVVQDKKLIIFHRLQEHEIVECLNVSSGESVWKSSYLTAYIDDFQFDDGPRATPIIHKESVFTLGAAGDLTAWEMATGKKIWSKNIMKQYQVPKNFFGVGASGIIWKDRLIINVGGKGSGVVAFDCKTGKEIWKTSNQQASYSSPILIDSGKQSQIAVYTRQGLLLLDPELGKVLYEFPWQPRIRSSVNAASPVFAQNQYFISCCYGQGGIALQLKENQLTEVWKSSDLSCHYNTPIFMDGYIYGIDGRQEESPALCCFDWKSGKEQWRKTQFPCSHLLLANKTFLALTEKGELQLFAANPVKYEPLDSAKILKAPVRAAPAISNQSLFARDHDKLIAVSLQE